MLAELDRLALLHDRSIDEIGRDEIVETVARAALLGARGNSGVILSQLIRGAAEELVSRPGELVDPVLLGAAFATAAQRAYASVREPAEGTMLTVMRDMATSIAHDLAHLPEDQRRLAAAADPEQQNLLIAAALERAIVAGEASVQRGPELLPALREAGVVDAGGYGVIIIFAGIVAALKGTDAPELDHYAPARITHPEHASETYRYCTNFAVTGQGLEASRYVPKLEEIGDSVLVVGDHATLKVHVHTDDPEQATLVFDGAGEVSRLDVADMHAQVVEREARLSAIGSNGHGNGNGAAAFNGGATAVADAEHQQCCGALAVATGAGLVALFESLGARVLDGGPTLNPSTMEILAGIHDVPAEEVVVLPNSPNVFMAAERAAELSEKVVRVVPSRSQQAGLSAAFALNAERGAGENADGDAGGAGRRAHRRRRARRAPGSRRPLRHRRRRRLRRRGARRVGRAARHLGGGPRAAVGRRRARDLHRGRRRSARQRRGRGAGPRRRGARARGRRPAVLVVAARGRVARDRRRAATSRPRCAARLRPGPDAADRLRARRAS